jgi:ATP-dependent helicase/nuclease subunit B
MRRLLATPDYASAIAAAGTFIAGLPPNSESLVLAPTRGAADELLRSSPRATFGVHRKTPLRLAADLAAPAMAERGLAPATRLSLEAVAARVADLRRKREPPSYFQPVLDTPGFPRALTRTLLDLRLEGVGREMLAASGESGGDLVWLAELFDAQLAEHGLADAATVLRLATEAAAAMPARPLVLLDIDVASPAHERFLAAAVAGAPSVLATVLVGDEDGRARWEGILGVAAEEIGHADRGSLARVRRYLFSARPPEVVDRDAGVDLFSQPGEGLECVEIARRLRALARGGLAFDRAAILLRDPERYLPLVEEALRRAGIPAHFTRASARPDPAGRAFLALLACALEGCSASRFAEYLSLGQAPALDSEGAPRRSDAEWTPPEDEAWPEPGERSAERAETNLSLPHRWERLMVDAAVVGGRDRWARRLRGLETECRVQLAAAEDDGEHARLERKIEQLDRLQRFALPIVEMLAALPKRAVWNDWIDALTELALSALRDPEGVLATLNELWPMRDVGPVDLDEVVAALGERLRFLRREPPGRRYGRVFVGAVEDARGRAFEVVFLPGLAEGLFPRKVVEDPLLLDEQRRRVSPGLERRDGRVARERLLLRIAAAAGSRLVVSYPRLEVSQGRPRVPSFYALEVVRAAEGRLPDLREFERRAAAGAEARLGWPAPRDEQQAIDDAEYDLATLDRLLDDRSSPAGAARYLIEVNPHLGRSLRARWKRWSRRWSDADGIVDPDEATGAALAIHRLSARPYSPSALERFAACPYQFLLYAIHRLRRREESVALEHMDPLTRGALFHSAQFAVFQALEQQGLLDFGPAQLETALDVADRVLDHVAADYREKLAPAIARVWKSEVDDVRVDLRGWLREQAHKRGDWAPYRFEFSFGLGGPDAGHDPRSVAEEAVIDRARLRGSIDLIERSPGGELRVTDHKSGRAPDRMPANVGGGACLQPALYGMVVEQLLGAPVVSGRLWFCTQRGGYREATVALAKAKPIAIEALRIIDEEIASGFLPAAPRIDHSTGVAACDYCDFRPVCGPYEAERGARKPKPRLENLIALRNLS